MAKVVDPAGAAPTRFGGLSRHAIRIGLWALPVAALANIVFFIWTLDGRPLTSIAEQPWWLAIAAGLAIVPWFTNVARLAIWCRFLEVRLSLRQMVRIVLGTSIANSITPTATGSTVIKWGFLVGEKVPAGKSSTLISAQIAEDTIVMLTMFAIAVFYAFGFELPATLRALDWQGSAKATTENALLILLFLILLVTVTYKAARRGVFGIRIRAAAARAGSTISTHLHSVGNDWKRILKRGKLVAAASMGLSVIQWGARYSVATAVIGFAGAQMQPFLYWALQWLTFTFSTMVPTPGGIGGSEAAFLLLYAPFVPPDTLGPVMVIWRLVLFYVPTAIAALLFLGVRGRVGARPD